MKVIKLTLGQLETNAYILKKDHKVLIIDPGSEFYKIKKHIEEDDQVLAILLTHGHFDHIGAVNDVLKEYDCDIYIDKDEIPLIKDPSMSFYEGNTNHDYKYFKPETIIDNFKMIIHKTPGHTYGSVMIEIDDSLFSGDTLFKQGVGRMDLPTGSQREMLESIKYIKSFTKDYIVYPGHGENTRLQNELIENPYYK